jgi:ATP-dependent helicase HrpA/adenine-specific DNA-methyltransferase
LRREQTDEEKELWRALRAGRFAGFKFRRQHPLGIYFLDFFCPVARLSIELDGSQHGFPEQRQRDVEREKFLAEGSQVEWAGASAVQFRVAESTWVGANFLRKACSTSL